MAKINPINIVNGSKEEKSTIGNNTLAKIANHAVDAKNLIDIGTVVIDGAMLLGYAKFCRQHFDDIK